MIEETKQGPSAVEDLAAEIESTLARAFDVLIEQRDRAYADAIAPLNAEGENLAQEFEAIEEASRNLKLVLPAQERELRREADRLLVEGKFTEAETKLAEAEQAGHGLEAMSGRRGEISSRLEAIEEEKKAQARRVFADWYPDCQKVIRPIEHGLFVSLLDGLRKSFFDFQAVTNTAGDGVLNTLFKQYHLAGLTADERSAEWLSGSKWYGTRR